MCCPVHVSALRGGGLLEEDSLVGETVELHAHD